MSHATATLCQIINPAVTVAAERFTDGRITDGLLADVAAMERLPLYVQTVVLAPTPAEIADIVLRNAAARVREAKRLYVFARAEQSRANKFPPAHHVRRGAFSMLNRRRAQLARAERDHAAAQASVDALAAPVALALAA